MKRFWLNIALLSVAANLSIGTIASAQHWACPNADEAREKFQSGEAKSWPHYTEADAARVQRQHPKTGLVAQTKFIGSGSRSAGICQYYNHVGLLFTFFALGAKKGELQDEAHWREEWTESYPEQDKPGEEMIDVCVMVIDGVEWPSVKCPLDFSEG